LSDQKQYFGFVSNQSQKKIKIPSQMRGLNKKTILSNIFSEKYVNKSPISREVSLVAGQFGKFIHQDTTYLTQFHQ
jgi:hypothetical protein